MAILGTLANCVRSVYVAVFAYIVKYVTIIVIPTV